MRATAEAVRLVMQQVTLTGKVPALSAKILFVLAIEVMSTVALA